MHDVAVLYWVKKEAGVRLEGECEFHTNASSFSFKVVLEVIRELQYVGGEWEICYSPPIGKMLTVEDLKAAA
jgi:hypothetical protein